MKKFEPQDQQSYSAPLKFEPLWTLSLQPTVIRVKAANVISSGIYGNDVCFWGFNKFGRQQLFSENDQI